MAMMSQWSQRVVVRETSVVVGVFRWAMRGAVRTVRGRGRGLARLPAAGLTLAPGWRKTSDVEPPTVHPFSEAQGPTTMLPPGTSPISFFKQIFGTDYFDNLAETTNLNAVVKAPPVGWGPHARLATSDRSWHPTTAIELKAFVAINITMGIKELPEYKDGNRSHPPRPLRLGYDDPEAVREVEPVYSLLNRCG